MDFRHEYMPGGGMKILCLYHNPLALELFQWIKEQGNDVILHDGYLEPQWCREQAFDLTVSYTYRYILTEGILDALGNNVVNIHNSFLPFNRGANPNIWSILDETPRGVTLHYMNIGLDKGNIIVQDLVADCSERETLESSYNELDEAAKRLFKKAFACYGFWRSMGKEPQGAGSYHSIKDGSFIKDLTDTYNITIADFKKRYREYNYRKTDGEDTTGWE